jgi:hypothetical protein
MHDKDCSCQYICGQSCTHEPVFIPYQYTRDRFILREINYEFILEYSNITLFKHVMNSFKNILERTQIIIIYLNKASDLRNIDTCLQDFVINKNV